ncbi:MAG: SDR family NAD(P)-dependent oxidoreductase [Stenotrophobium sp.]
MKNYQTALITGASSGIGEAFAEALAKEGMDLILVARSKDKLEEIAVRLAMKHDRRVEVITADLSRPQPGAALLKKVQALGMDVDLLLNNAGFGTVGSFHKLDVAREHEEVMLNVAAVVDIAHAFLPGMLERGRGGIINTASVAGFQPIPFMSVYAASKAFVLSFSHGLWGEYRKQGIHVLAVCPGPVDTGFFEATGNKQLRSTVPSPLMMTAEKVVAQSLRAFKAGETVVVPGVQNKAVTWMSRVLPRKLNALMMAQAMKR